MLTLLILLGIIWFLRLFYVGSVSNSFLRYSSKTDISVLNDKYNCQLGLARMAKQHIWLVLLLFGGPYLSAQTVPNLLQRDNSASRQTSDNYIEGSTSLVLDEAILKSVIQKQPKEWTITVPSDELGELTLILKKRSLFTDNFTYSGPANEATDILDLHYTGQVESYADSKVALSITHTEVNGLIQLPGKIISLEKMVEAETKKHVVYDYRKRASLPVLECADTDTMPSGASASLALKRTNDDPACVSIRVEVDSDFRGNVGAVMNQVASIYEAIGIEIKVSEIYHWRTPSPYTGTTREVIKKIQASVEDRTNLDGDITLFIAARGNGGRASAVGSVCEKSSVCYSGQNSDVYTVAHELGHLFSAHHTHACKWNGNNTALDGCGYNAGYGGCPGQDPREGGTILSYCHIRSVGVNLEFHPQVANLMFSFLKSKSDCTCKSSSNNIVEEEVEEEIEEEYEEEISIEQGGENITANICQMSFINPKSCAVDIYTLTNNVQGTLLATINPKATTNTAIIKNATYGVYADGILVDQFTATCGTVFSISSCVTVGDRVTGKVILEGFYNATAKNMHQQLVEQNLLSKQNPYKASPWNNDGVVSIETIPTNAVDWVLIMSRSIEGTILGQAVGFINTTGELMDIHGKAGIALENANGQHLSIHHRGHMAVMTAVPYQSGANIDFTASAKSVLGNGQLKSIGGTFVLHAGDYDANGVINNMDYNHWVSKSSKINLYVPADGDGNGVINNKDYNLWIANRSKIGHGPLRY